jgi:hypothetical protein
MRGDEADRAFRSPARGEALAPGSVVEVRWDAACGAEDRDADGDREENEAELVLSLDGGVTFPLRVSTELSPCAARFAWRVPALATSRARLGLRTGEDDREEEERIEVVSDVFAILPDADGAPEPLYAHGAEWWTPEPPSARRAEDAVRPTLGGSAVLRSERVAWTELGAPPPSASSARPAPRAARELAPRPRSARASAQSLAAAPASPTPMRC